eukprot:403354451
MQNTDNFNQPTIEEIQNLDNQTRQQDLEVLAQSIFERKQRFMSKQLQRQNDQSLLSNQEKTEDVEMSQDMLSTKDNSQSQDLPLLTTMKDTSYQIDTMNKSQNFQAKGTINSSTWQVNSSKEDFSEVLDCNKDYFKENELSYVSKKTFQSGKPDLISFYGQSYKPNEYSLEVLDWEQQQFNSLFDETVFVKKTEHKPSYFSTSAFSTKISRALKRKGILPRFHHNLDYAKLCNFCDQFGHSKQECKDCYRIPPCERCGSKAHYFQFCESERCTLCFRVGHMPFSDKCDFRMSAICENKFEFCLICGSSSHFMSSQCLLNKSLQSRQDLKCFKCNQYGGPICQKCHLSSDLDHDQKIQEFQFNQYDCTVTWCINNITVSDVFGNSGKSNSKIYNPKCFNDQKCLQEVQIRNKQSMQEEDSFEMGADEEVSLNNKNKAELFDQKFYDLTFKSFCKKSQFILRTHQCEVILKKYYIPKNN